MSELGKVAVCQPGAPAGVKVTLLHPRNTIPSAMPSPLVSKNKLKRGDPPLQAPVNENARSPSDPTVCPFTPSTTAAAKANWSLVVFSRNMEKLPSRATLFVHDACASVEFPYAWNVPVLKRPA